MVQRGEHTCRSDPKKCSGAVRPSGQCAAVEIAIGAQSQAGGRAISVGSSAVEVEDHVECTRGRDRINRAAPLWTARLRAVKISISTLRHYSCIIHTASVDRTVKVMQVGIGLSLQVVRY